MRERMIEVFSFGLAVLIQDHLMVAHLMHLSSLYSRIQTGIRIVVGNETRIEF